MVVWSSLPQNSQPTHFLKFIEQPQFDLHQIYRALEFLAKETDFIQSLYENSLKISKRNTGVLFYDCTNYFWNRTKDGDKQYGPSKEHRPNPIIQMGLFMDGDGIPLAFSINRGNMNEQLTLKPLEKKIISDFEFLNSIVCSMQGWLQKITESLMTKRVAHLLQPSPSKTKSTPEKWAWYWRLETFGQY